MIFTRLLEGSGLGAAWAGAISALRGDWERAAGCFVFLVSVSVVVALWTE